MERYSAGYVQLHQNKSLETTRRAAIFRTSLSWTPMPHRRPVGEILRGLFRFPFRASFCAFVTCPMIIALMLALAVRLAAEALKGNCLLAPRISSN